MTLIKRNIYNEDNISDVDNNDIWSNNNGVDDIDILQQTWDNDDDNCSDDNYQQDDDGTKMIPFYDNSDNDINNDMTTTAPVHNIMQTITTIS